VWTVAIEGDDVLPAGGGEVSKNRGESCCETFAFLRYDLYCIAYQVSQFVLIRFRAHYRDLHARQ
jgi:hypothetical protein